MTAHYSVVQIDELVEALNRINNEGSRVNRKRDNFRRYARYHTFFVADEM